jgi:hypothetical protein
MKSIGHEFKKGDTVEFKGGRGQVLRGTVVDICPNPQFLSVLPDGRKRKATVHYADLAPADQWKKKGLPAVARAVAEIEEAKAHTKTDHQFEVLDKALDLLAGL